MRLVRNAIESIGSIHRERSTGSKPTSTSTGTFAIDEQYATPDFLYKEEPNKLQKARSPIGKKVLMSKNYFALLIELEKKVLNPKNRTVDLVAQLVSMYRQCVELYDSQKDPIKYYFLDKIQAALEDQTFQVQWDFRQPLSNSFCGSTVKETTDDDNEEFHDVVDLSNNVAQQGKQTVFSSPNTSIANLSLPQSRIIESQPQQIQPQQEKPSTYQQVNEKIHQIITSQKQKEQQNVEDPEEKMRSIQKARSKRVSIQKQVHIQTETNNDHMSTMVNSHVSSAQQTDKLIQAELVIQDQSIQDRLRRRGTKTMYTKGMTHSHTTGILDTPNKDLQSLFNQIQGK